MKKKLPELGDKRTLKKFAWYPIRTDDNYKIWLENFSAKQEFKKHQSNGRWFRTRRSTYSNVADFIIKK